MINKSQIHSSTSNFPNLQGLNAIPTSLTLLLLVVWSDQQTGATRDLALPLLISFGMALFYWLVDQ